MDPKEFYLSKPWLKYYPKGVPSEVDVPAISVPELFDQKADKYAGKTALIFYGTKITYGKLKELIDRFATALGDLGVIKGQTVALYLLNCPQRDRVFCGAESGSQGHSHQPGLYQPGSEASA